MAIDAVIQRVQQTDEGLRLELGPRSDADGEDTLPGQRALTIVGERTFDPEVGMEIWGGADLCELVIRDRAGQVRAKLDYRRIGYTRLEERSHTCAKCGEKYSDTDGSWRWMAGELLPEHVCTAPTP